MSQESSSYTSTFKSLMDNVSTCRICLLYIYSHIQIFTTVSSILCNLWRQNFATVPVNNKETIKQSWKICIHWEKTDIDTQTLNWVVSWRSVMTYAMLQSNHDVFAFGHSAGSMYCNSTKKSIVSRASFSAGFNQSHSNNCLKRISAHKGATMKMTYITKGGHHMSPTKSTASRTQRRAQNFNPQHNPEHWIWLICMPNLKRYNF